MKSYIIPPFRQVGMLVRPPRFPDLLYLVCVSTNTYECILYVVYFFINLTNLFGIVYKSSQHMNNEWVLHTNYQSNSKSPYTISTKTIHTALTQKIICPFLTDWHFWNAEIGGLLAITWSLFVVWETSLASLLPAQVRIQTMITPKMTELWLKTWADFRQHGCNCVVSGGEC